MMHTWWRIGIGVGTFLLLLLGVSHGATHVQAQQANLDDAIKAVVRIVPQRCDLTGCRPVGVGSGTIIHPAGVILTAWHVTVTDPENLVTPIYADDFVIEMTEDIRRRPQARYRAELLAVKPEMDLALLRIYQEEDSGEPISLGGSSNFPVLPLSEEMPRSGQFWILGYPPAGGDSIKYPTFALSGFADDGALFTVQGTLSEGFSGGPALIEHNGQFQIVGLVIRRRGLLGEVGLLRNIRELYQLQWQPNTYQAWGEGIQVDTQEINGISMLHIGLDLHMLDFVGKEGRLLVYVFDAGTRQPWRASNTALPRAANGQLVLRQDFSAQRAVDVQPAIGFDLPLSELEVAPDRLLFRLLLWNLSDTRVLWQASEWYRARPVAITPNLPMGATEQAETLSATAAPNPAATQTAQAYQLEIAIAATLAARLPATATPTPTLNFEQQIAVAVNATLTAQAPPAPTATTKPTILPMATPTTMPQPTVPPTILPTPTCLVEPAFQSTWRQYAVRLGCYTDAVQTTVVTLQTFERGFMLWVEATDQIYVLRRQAHWSHHTNEWNAQEDVYSCETARTHGGPVRGFGKLWCSDQTLQTEIGLAIDKEAPYAESKMQRYQRGQLFLVGADQIFVLFDDQSWTAQ